MKNANIIKEQLGVAQGTAANRLKKKIMFDFVQRLGLDNCHQCGEKIQTAKELSVEHIKPYLHSGKAEELYFDLNNIAFSHFKCNCGAGGAAKRKSYNGK